MATPNKHGALSTHLNPCPQEAFSGTFNGLLSGTSGRFYAPNLAGPLSIKGVLSGSVIWETENRRYIVRENSYLVLNQGQPYNFLIETATPTTTCSVFFQHGFVEEAHRVMTQPHAALLDSPDGPRPGSLVFRERLEPEPSRVLAILRRLEMAKSCGATTLTAVEEEFLRIAQALILEFLRADEGESRLSAVRATTREELMRRVFRGRDFLLSRMDEPISIADAAREACMSRYHFFRVFRAAFGVTPHQFLTFQRLLRALMLLRTGKHTVTEVCFECGFQSPASFSLFFRRHFGISPSEERGGKEEVQRKRPLKEISTFR
jgi:AraC-like DNA-binding protein